VDVDPALVRACQRGEPAALDALIRATYADVYALARRMLADPDEASDATQEVFVRVMRSVLGFRGESTFGTWLHRVTVNVCLTMLRKRSRAREAGLVAGRTPFGLPDDESWLVASGPQPDEAAETSDLAARSEAAIATLPEDARAVVVLRDIEGLSTKEVADLLGVTESVVKVRLHRAHARLRTLITTPAGAATPANPDEKAAKGRSERPQRAARRGVQGWER
jgi:RNA polymerase sigma-70 factor (ECF subfamily)